MGSEMCIRDSYYAALNSFYGQPDVASALSAVRTLTSDTSAYNDWVTSFFGAYADDYSSIQSQYADVFTQNAMETGTVSIPSVDESDLSSLVGSITSAGNAESVASTLASAGKNATSSKSGSGLSLIHI